MACISISEVIGAMPETKKADTTLAQYQAALQQQFDTYKAEYTQQASLLGSPDTAKLTKPLCGARSSGRLRKGRRS